MEDLPLDVAHFMGLIIAIWMYGIVLAMFFASIRPLWDRRHRTKLVLVITFLLLITSTANVVVSIGRGYAGFITYREDPGVVAYMEGWSVYEPLSNFFLAAAIVTADALLIFRLFTIWSRNRWIVVLPIILVCIESVCAIILCVMSAMPAKASYASNMAFDEVVIILSSTCTLLANLICTPCIVARLWWIGRRGQTKETKTFYTVVIVRLIESGSLYTASLIIWVVFQVLPNYPGVGELTNYIFIMIIAIAPMLIVMHLNALTSAPSTMRDMVQFEKSNGQSGSSADGTDSRAAAQNNMIGSTTIAFKAMQSVGTDDSRTTQDMSFRPTRTWNRSELEDEDLDLDLDLEDNKVDPVDNVTPDELPL